jgi:hypothetical protein
VSTREGAKYPGLAMPDTRERAKEMDLEMIEEGRRKHPSTMRPSEPSDGPRDDRDGHGSRRRSREDYDRGRDEDLEVR